MGGSGPCESTKLQVLPLDETGVIGYLYNRGSGREIITKLVLLIISITMVQKEKSIQNSGLSIIIDSCFESGCGNAGRQDNSVSQSSFRLCSRPKEMN